MIMKEICIQFVYMHSSLIKVNWDIKDPTTPVSIHAQITSEDPTLLIARDFALDKTVGARLRGIHLRILASVLEALVPAEIYAVG